MKKKTIWTIAVIMGLSFLALLYLQLKYIEEMAEMKKEQFDESVHRALYQASRNLELNETLTYLEKYVRDTKRHDCKEDSARTRSDRPDKNSKQARPDTAVGKDTTSYSEFKLKTINTKLSQMPKAIILNNDRNSLNETSKSMQELVKNRYSYQKSLLDEIIYGIIYAASNKPLRERINFKLLDLNLKTQLNANGIRIPYHFTVLTQDGREIYRCPDYTDDGIEYSYSQQLFRNDPVSKTGVVKIHFPDMNSYIFSSIRFMIPSVIFTLVLLVTFIFTIVVIFRQKRYTEIKNDFINNMTHELKTPIASISLAAQMLNDSSVSKSEAMMAHLGKVINDETKRLRFLVEKVLQMSMFDRRKAVFRKKELDLNEMVENVANSFTLRVEHTGGKIYTDIEAVDSKIYVDEMHFQNAIFNLMDNAVKYSSPDHSLDIYMKTWNDDHFLYLSIRDTGIGIKKENLKKIFEKFYRDHTGNRHDAKGFGLGLAYVKKVVDLHKGEIHVDSEYKKGTTFTIKLPVIRD